MKLFVALFVALFVGAACGQLFDPAPVTEPEKPGFFKRIFSVPGKIVRSVLDALRIIYQIQRHLFGHTVEGLSDLIEHLKATLKEVVRTLTGKTVPDPTFNDLPYGPLPAESLGYQQPYGQSLAQPYGQPYPPLYPEPNPQPYGQPYRLPYGQTYGQTYGQSYPQTYGYPGYQNPITYAF